MIRSFALLCIVAALGVPARGQTLWQWQHPRPLGHAWYALATTDEHTMYAVGTLSTSLKTTDQGATWHYITGVDDKTLQWSGISFSDATHGVALGWNAAYLSTDGGATWTRKPVADTTHGYTSMSFTDANHGWIAGYSGAMERTTDGGATWSAMTSGTTSVLTIAFADSLNGWAVGAVGLVLHTTNGGVTWASLGNISTNGLIGAAFRSASTGIVVGGSGSIYRTTDAGVTWSARTSGTTEALYGIAYQNDLTVVAVGNTGVILRSVDGGLSWARRPVKSDIVFRAVTMRASGTGWTVGNNGVIYLTTDGGDTWNEKSSVLTYSPINDLQFVTPDAGVACDSKGAILKTTDAGEHWAAIDTAQQSLYMIHFSTPLTGSRVDWQGGVDTTTDGGTTWWKKGTIPTGAATPLFLKGQFVTESIWFAMGAAGTLAKTTDAGTTWQHMDTKTTNYCYGLHFRNSQRGWMSGAGSTLRKTTNGGTTWDTVKTGLSGTLYSVFFVDDSVGWVAGGDGALVKTTDGGATWFGQTTGLTNGTVQSMVFFDRLSGYLGPTVTTLGSLLRTTNGGTSWFKEDIGTTFVVNCMVFTDAEHGWIAGNSGGILRKNAGATPVEAASSHPVPGMPLLEQNYPNPFNPVTRIGFVVPSHSRVRLAIYDLLGREVTTLVDEVMAPGRYERQFDGTGCASGVYLCRLTAGSFVNVTKLVLVR